MKGTKRLFLSGSVFILAKVSAAYSAETSTASNVLSNLLTTTAGAITQSQPVQQANQSAAAVPQAVQNVPGSQTANGQPVDNGESVLPNFDDLVNDTPKPDSAPVVASGISPSSENPQVATPQVAAPQVAAPQAAMLQAAAPQMTASQAPMPQTATSQAAASQASVSQVTASQAAAQAVPQSALPTMPSSENASVPVQTSMPSPISDKKVGFVDTDGNAWIAPADMVFPEGMRDGEMFIFSKDIDALKRKLQEAKLQETRNSQQLLPQTNAGNYQGAPAQTSSNQAALWSANRAWQYSPGSTRDAAASANNPWRLPLQSGTSQTDSSGWRDPRQNQQGSSSNGLPGVPSGAQDVSSLYGTQYQAPSQQS